MSEIYSKADDCLELARYLKNKIESKIWGCSSKIISKENLFKNNVWKKFL